jgi:hypothetical protein
VAEVRITGDIGAQAAHFTVFNLAGDGTVQRLFPTGRAGLDGPITLDRLPRLAARVTSPYGTDHLVVIATSQPPTSLRQRLQALEDRRAAGELIEALEQLLPPGQNRIGLVGLVTGARDAGS